MFKERAKHKCMLTYKYSVAISKQSIWGSDCKLTTTTASRRLFPTSTFRRLDLYIL